jgi:hypothetical protein
MPWQPTGILFPDIELELTGRYRAALAARAEPYAADVFVSNAVPSARRDRMVIVRRDGGTEAEFRDRPRVSLRVWATTEKDVNDLARLVRALAPTFADGDPIVAVPLNARSGPVPVADESGQPLRLLNIEFHTRGELA